MNPFVLVVILLSLFTLTPNFAEKQASPETQLQNISKIIEKNTKKIKVKKKEKLSAERRLSRLKRELRYTNLKLSSTKRNLVTAKRKEKQSKKQLQTANKKFRQKQDFFEKRLREIYKTKNISFIDFLFAPQELTSMSESQYYFRHILKEDIALIETLREDYLRYQEQKEKYEKHTQRIKEMREDISVKENQLSRKKKIQSYYITKLESQIVEMERKNRELQKSSGRIAQLIQKQGLGKKGYYGTGQFIKPVKGWLSSRFGYRKHPIFKRRIRHNGIDLAAPRGYKIKAADSGVVIVAGEKKMYRGYGKITIIDHGRRKDGHRVSSVYAHQSRLLVKEGDFVKKGDEIGWVGATGYATGPHLHFEIRIDGQPVNPLKYMKL